MLATRSRSCGPEALDNSPRGLNKFTRAHLSPAEFAAGTLGKVQLMPEFLRCAAACRGSRTTTDALSGGDVRTERRAAGSTRFDALSSKQFETQVSQMIPRRRTPIPDRMMAGATRGSSIMRGARLVPRSLRCTIIDPLSEALTFGLISLIVLMIVANPVFQKTGDQDWSQGDDPTLCLPECRTGLTSACATYSSISVKELPDVLVKATLATGDRRFYSHFGFDLTAIALSLHAAPGTQAVRSSITQQVARILFPSDQPNLEVRIQEALVAIWLEWRLSKDEILKIYLNRVQIGGGIFGVSKAAQSYFQKQVQDIELGEAALLAGLINAPLDLSSHVALPNARERANLVLDTLLETGLITNDQLFAAKQHPARLIFMDQDASPN